MRFFRAITRLQAASALTLLGISLALVPLGLEAIGYQLGPEQGYAILAAAALFVVAAVVVFFWPWIRGGWSWLRRDGTLRDVEQERDALQDQVTQLQNRVAPPPLSELKRVCIHLADELEDEHRRYLNSEERVKLWEQELKEQGLSESEIEQQVARAEDENAMGTLNKYNKQLKGRLLNLHDVLGPQGWFGPVDRSRFENLSDPYNLDNLAKRLREVCGKLSGDPDQQIDSGKQSTVELRSERLEEELRETKQERDKLKQENAELIAESDNRPSPVPDTLEEWQKTTPLLTVQNRTFRNDRIELDGFHYARCVFDSCTFSFKGTKPFIVAESCRIEGGYNIDATRSPQASAILVFLKSLGAMPDTEYRDPIDGGLVD